MSRWLAFCVLAAALFAQQPAQAPVDAAVSGVVKDSVSGKPLAHYNLSTFVGANYSGGVLYTGRNTRQVEAVSDEEGRYRLTGLPPGTYRITARNAEDFGSDKTRTVVVAGHDIDGIDFAVVRNGEISGKVVDENKEPVPDLRVELVSRDYFKGLLGYYIREVARTDDRGQYHIPRVEPNQPYLVMAEKLLPETAHSDAPLDPKLRRRTPMRTYYPSVTDKESAAPVTITPGEHREGVDITLRKSQSFCVEGVAQGPMGPGPLRVAIQAAQPSTGTTASGGMFTPIPGGPAASDGKFRLCDLYPGEFRLSAAGRIPGFNEQQPNVDLGLEFITITDRDLENVRVTAAARQLNGETLLDGPAPLAPLTTKASILLTPLLRQGLDGERPNARADIPGEFTLTGLLPALYGVQARVNGPGLYVKDIAYGGRSIPHEPLRFDGGSSGNALTITLGQDGATFSVAVTDKDGNPVADAKVIAFPQAAITGAVLQDSITQGETDQMGQFTSAAVAPGKYYVAATFDGINDAPESLARVLRNRGRFQEIELPPGGSQNVTLAVIRLE